MIENGTMKVGGNTFGIWFGKLINLIGKEIDKFGLWLKETGEILAKLNTAKLVTNPSAKLYNPFTLIINFTVDSLLKYQIVLQGDYKKEYKECENGDIKLTEHEIFLIINQHQKEWFKKE
jgi:hypothetical protein